MISVSELCKRFPKIMRSLIFLLLFSGIGTIIICIAIIYDSDDFIDAHKEFFDYIFKLRR